MMGRSERARGRSRRARGADVVGRLHEAQRHHVDAHGNAGAKIVDVLRSQRRRPQHHAGQVDALVRVELAAGHHPRRQSRRRDGLDLELDPSVVEQQPLAGRDGREERVERARNAPRAAGGVAFLDDERVAVPERKWRVQRTGANLRSAQILQHRDLAIGGR